MRPVLQSLFFGALALTGLPAGAEAPIRVVISSDGLGTRGLAYSQNLVAAVGAESHLQMHAAVEPNDRSVASFRDGQYQVIVGRQASFEDLVPGSHRVATPILLVNYVAVGADPTLKLKHWSDLRDLRVGHVLGNRYVIKAIDGIVQRREQAPTSQACLAMAAHRRVDVCIIGVAPNIARPDQVDGVRIYDSKVDSVALYLWTHPAQAQLASQLDAALKAMDQRGDIRRLQLAHE